MHSLASIGIWSRYASEIELINRMHNRSRENTMTDTPVYTPTPPGTPPRIVLAFGERPGGILNIEVGVDGEETAPQEVLAAMSRMLSMFATTCSFAALYPLADAMRKIAHKLARNPAKGDSE